MLVMVMAGQLAVGHGGAWLVSLLLVMVNGHHIHSTVVQWLDWLLRGVSVE